jgi:hypothetical protein
MRRAASLSAIIGAAAEMAKVAIEIPASLDHRDSTREEAGALDSRLSAEYDFGRRPDR